MTMDPQIRLLLKRSYEAIANSGLNEHGGFVTGLSLRWRICSSRLHPTLQTAHIFVHDNKPIYPPMRCENSLK
jgi:hypothetical protein